MKRLVILCALAFVVSAVFAGAALAAKSIVGTERADTLEGTPGAETMRGLAGADEVFGRPGSDLLYGGAGGDRIKGGAGLDDLFGGPGDDSIDARDGEKDGTINCGAGFDTVRTDGREATFNCEREVFSVPMPTP